MAPRAILDLARLTADEFVRYFRHLAARVERAALTVPEDQLWIKPFPFGNSIGHLVLHLTGNLNHYIGAIDRRHRLRPASRARVHRHRAILATSSWRTSIKPWTMVVRRSNPGRAGFATPVADQPPIQTRFGLFLVCAAHLNNHIGQMSYLVQALQSTTRSRRSGDLLS